MFICPSETFFFFDDPHKHNRDKNPSPDPLHIYPFPEDPELCPWNFLNIYIKRVKPDRQKQSALFLSTVKPYNSITTSETIGRWLKEILRRVGINISLFKGHSVRKAASSKAKVRGATVREIMERGKWSHSSTWESFYHKKIENPQEKFQNILLGGFTRDRESFERGSHAGMASIF